MSKHDDRFKAQIDDRLETQILIGGLFLLVVAAVAAIALMIS